MLHRPITAFLVLMCLAGCSMLPKPGAKKPQGPPLPKSIPALPLPNPAHWIEEKISTLAPHQSKAEESELYFAGPPNATVRLRLPNQSWSREGPIRILGRPHGYILRFTNEKRSSWIQVIIRQDRGSDAFAAIDSERRRLSASDGSAVMRRTTYQNTDNVTLRRADLSCMLGQDDKMHTSVAVSFHDARSSMAIAPFTMRLVAEWPRKHERELATALYQLTAFVRIVYQEK